MKPEQFQKELKTTGFSQYTWVTKEDWDNPTEADKRISQKVVDLHKRSNLN